MIVDGQHQFVGSDEAEARRAIASAARAAKAVVEVDVVLLNGPDDPAQDRVTVRIAFPARVGDGDGAIAIRFLAGGIAPLELPP